MRKIVRLAVVVAGVVLVGSGVALANSDHQELRLNYAYDEANYLIVFHSSPVDDGDCVPPVGTVEATYDTFVDGWAEVTGLDPSDGYDLGDCPTSAWQVQGPQGQVNHGQVVRTFSHAVGPGHKGCLMRWIAGSDFGKHDQQVRTPDAVPDFEPAATGDLQFMTQVTCHGGGPSAEGLGASAADDHSGRGNSGSAPGHNKQP